MALPGSVRAGALHPAAGNIDTTHLVDLLQQPCPALHAQLCPGIRFFGAGKSKSLKAIAGLVKASSGTVMWKGDFLRMTG